MSQTQEFSFSKGELVYFSSGKYYGSRGSYLGNQTKDQARVMLKSGLIVFAPRSSIQPESTVVPPSADQLIDPSQKTKVEKLTEGMQALIMRNAKNSSSSLQDTLTLMDKGEFTGDMSLFVKSLYFLKFDGLVEVAKRLDKNPTYKKVFDEVVILLVVFMASRKIALVNSKTNAEELKKLQIKAQNVFPLLGNALDIEDDFTFQNGEKINKLLDVSDYKATNTNNVVSPQAQKEINAFTLPLPESYRKIIKDAYTIAYGIFSRVGIKRQ